MTKKTLERFDGCGPDRIRTGDLGLDSVALNPQVGDGAPQANWREPTGAGPTARERTWPTDVLGRAGLRRRSAAPGRRQAGGVGPRAGRDGTWAAVDSYADSYAPEQRRTWAARMVVARGPGASDQECGRAGANAGERPRGVAHRNGVQVVESSNLSGPTAQPGEQAPCGWSARGLLVV